MNNTFKDDLEQIVSINLPWQQLENSTMLITGSTGLIGGILEKSIKYANEKHNLNIVVIPYTRNDNGGVQFPLRIEQNIDYIFHCASVTKSAEMIEDPLNVINVAVDGTRNIMELACLKKVKSVVYLSSMEVYGIYDGEVDESKLGYIDLNNIRSCYSEGKRMGELLCNIYFKKFDVPVKIARLAQTFGAGTPKTDTRVFSQFAHSAIAKKDIVLHTDGKSRGNYCYIADTVAALFTLLLKGENGDTYNISSESMTILEMAELVAKEFGINAKVEIPKDITIRGYAPKTGYTLNTEKIAKLGWKPRYGVLDSYKRMIKYWQGT